MNRIRELRLRHDLTMAELGKRVGCSEASISNYELSKRQAKYETLLRLAEELETSVDYLLGNSNPESELASEAQLNKEMFLKYAETLSPSENIELAQKLLVLASRQG